MDDITPYMDRYKFAAVRDVLDRYGIRPILGVVPDCRDEGIFASAECRYNEDEFRDLIGELKDKGWTIAQHGTNHVYTTTESGLLGINPFSEFAGLSYDTQYTKLKQGKTALYRLGIKTELFMAPGHSFDENTLKALKILGYTAVTDGLFPGPYIRDDILFIPCTLTAYSRLKGIDTICLHPNNMSDEDITELEGFIKKHPDEALGYDEAFFRSIAGDYSSAIASAEASALKLRERRNRIASSEKLSGFLIYTNHSNRIIKWIKRILLSPLLFTKRFDRFGK